jgi:hypothetical protein
MRDKDHWKRIKMELRNYFAIEKLRTTIAYYLQSKPVQVIEYERRGEIVNKAGIDDSESRKTIWKILFGDEPMPEGKRDIDLVEKYFGTFDSDLKKNVDLEELLRRANY